MAHEMNGDVSSSDDDSVSLLSGLDARRTTGVAEEIVEAELDPGKVPESASCTAEDTHCSNSAPKSGNCTSEIPENSNDLLHLDKHMYVNIYVGILRLL